MVEQYHLQFASSLLAADIIKVAKAWSTGRLLLSPDIICIPFLKAPPFLQ